MEEIWRDIEGYEGKYQVSNKGRVKSCDIVINNRLYKGVILSQRHKENNPKSYMTVNLKKNSIGKTKFVHRLVAYAFQDICGEYFCGGQVNHKDEDKMNNCAENLEWVTAQYNSNYGERNNKIMESRIKSGYVNPSNVGFKKEDYMKRYRELHKGKKKESKK